MRVVVHQRTHYALILRERIVIVDLVLEQFLEEAGLARLPLLDFYFLAEECQDRCDVVTGFVFWQDAFLVYDLHVCHCLVDAALRHVGVGGRAEVMQVFLHKLLILVLLLPLSLRFLLHLQLFLKKILVFLLSNLLLEFFILCLLDLFLEDFDVRHTLVLSEV